MPRRKKNRKNKNRKGRAKKPENEVNKENSIVSTSDDVMRTCIDNDSLNRSKHVSPSESIRPLRTPSPQLDTTKPFEDEVSPIKSTPVNKKRSMNRPVRKKSNGSMNVTNLNILFDSNFVYNSPKADSDIQADKSNISVRKRSSSSIAKLHSPGKEKPLSISKSTQTNTEIMTPARFGLQNGCEVVETPKFSKVFLLQEMHSDKRYELPTLNNHWLKNDKSNNSDKSKKVFNEVNINPYLNNKEIKIVNRDGSFDEISFFSPNLFQHKSSSTPIEKLQQANNIMDYLKDSLAKDNANDCSFNLEKVTMSNNRDSPVTPNMHRNLNLNRTLPSAKVLNKEGNIGSLKMQTANLSKRRTFKTSPKSTKVIMQTRILNKSQNFTYSRLNISGRSVDDGMSESLCRPTRTGMCEKVLTRLKRYTKVSHRWSVKVVELCAQLGIQLKNSLSSIMYTDRSMIENSRRSSCKCEEYKQEISSLSLKIEGLTEEIKTVRAQIDEQTNNKRSIEVLSQELNKVREELAQITELRAELQALKDQFKCFKAAPPPSSLSAPVPPPPPPPPRLPPPPPPPMPPLMLPKNSLKITKKAKNKEDANDNSRPVISLDDILKVKLKKASDRSGLHTPTTRRNSQPMVSMDMLRQVKLKPASRSSFRPDTPDTESSMIMTTSPHSSLCRRSLLGKRERDGS